MRNSDKLMKRRNGYTLVSTLVIGCFAITFLMALSGYVMSDTQSEARRKQSAMLSSAAEAGLDWAIHKFNTEYPCDLDPMSGNSLETPLPAGYLQGNYGTVSNNASNIDVKVTVKKLTDTDWGVLETFSTIYDPQLDYRKSGNHIAGDGTPPANNLPDNFDLWRVLECKATASGKTRKYRAILRPVLLSPTTGPSGTPVNPQPLFTYGLFANSSLGFGNAGVTVSSNETTPIDLDPVGGNKYRLQLATNKTADIGTGTNINGDLQVKSSFSNPSQIVINNDGTIHGRVTVNNGVNSSVNWTDGATATTGNNVLADADSPLPTPLPDPLPPTPPRVGANLTPVTTPSAESPVQLNPAATSSNSAQPLAPLSAIQGGMDPTITSGDYQTYGLTTANMDTSSPPVQIDSSGASSPVRIFVKDAPGSSEAVNIDASMFTNAGDARSLQIYYSGTKPVNVSLGAGETFSALVYAPLAPVATSGNGTFQGAIVGDTVSINHSGNMIVHTDLANLDPSGQNFAAGLYRDVDTSQSLLDQGWRWKPVTWEEVQ